MLALALSLKPYPTELLATLRQMVVRSSKLAMQLAVDGLMPFLLAIIDAGQCRSGC